MERQLQDLTEFAGRLQAQVNQEIDAVLAQQISFSVAASALVDGEGDNFKLDQEHNDEDSLENNTVSSKISNVNLQQLGDT